MTRGQNMAAASLEDLLNVARVQQHNGMLRAEYSHGGHREQGEIYLSGGQPVYAHTGRLLGAEALKYLLGWKNVLVAFVTDVPQPPANIMAAGRQPGATPPSNRHTQSLTPWHLPSVGEMQWSEQEQRSIQQISQPPLEHLAGIENVIPRKSRPDRDVFPLGLTRRQRLVYFLVDGRRTVSDLARTANKGVLEVETIMDDLQKRGLIEIPL